jgi:hypothetical protein
MVKKVTERTLVMESTLLRVSIRSIVFVMPIFASRRAEELKSRMSALPFCQHSESVSVAYQAETEKSATLDGSKAGAGRENVGRLTLPGSESLIPL